MGCANSRIQDQDNVVLLSSRDSPVFDPPANPLPPLLPPRLDMAEQAPLPSSVNADKSGEGVVPEAAAVPALKAAAAELSAELSAAAEKRKVETRSQQPAVQVRRKAESLVLVPIHLSVLEKAEPGRGWSEAVISLYRHVLPSLGRSHIIEIIEAARTETCLLVRSSDAAAEELALSASTTVASADGEGVEDEESDESKSSSSFSDSEAEDSEEEEEADDDGDEEEDDVEDKDDFLDTGPEDVARPTAKDRIVAAITWEHVPNTLRCVLASQHAVYELRKCWLISGGISLSPRSKLVQLTLIGCRTKYQELGIGARLMRSVKDPVSPVHHCRA